MDDWDCLGLASGRADDVIAPINFFGIEIDAATGDTSSRPDSRVRLHANAECLRIIRIRRTGHLSLLANGH